MNYTIGDAAKKIGVSTYTLRYYDKEGLLPFVQKNKSGQRVFTTTDMEWLSLIECLKETGMCIKSIKQYITWYLEGDSTLSLRLDMLKKQYRKATEQQKKILHHKEKIKYKIALYADLIKKAASK